jgi:uncharacterized repeat protein (TIGR01451 family)
MAHRSISRLVLAAFVVSAALVTRAPARAQRPQPIAPTPVVTVSASGHDAYSILEAASPEARATVLDTPLPTPADAIAQPSDTQTSSAAQPALFERIRVAGAGQVLVDATVNPIALRASDYLTYTYYYTNVSGTALNNVVAKLSWTGMAATEPTNVFDNAVHQFCSAGCQPFGVVGSGVTRGLGDPDGNNTPYTISSLGAGQFGHFSVGFRIRASFFPRSITSPTRPASSIEIYTNNGTVKESDDTVSALIVGPVLNVAKELVPGQPTRITISDTADFSITVGNATLPGDIIDNQARSDARPASNVVLRERIPTGAVYVPTSDPSGITRSFSSATNEVFWQLGALAIREQKAVTLRLRKDTSNNGCSLLNNVEYDVTADEYPIDTNTGSRAVIRGNSVSVGVVPSIDVYAIDLSNRSMIYGDETAVTFTLASYFNGPIANAKFVVNFPTTVGYVPGTASPSAGFAGPSTQTYGQPVTWTISLPSASPSEPKFITTSLRIKAAVLTNNANTFESLRARFLVPSNLPVGCLQESTTLVTTEPRLAIKIRRVLPNGNTPDLASDGSDLIEKRQQYRFEIEVKNKSNSLINGAVVTGELPFRLDFSPAFSYVVGSGVVNGVAREPNRIADGNGGFVAWDNTTLQPKSTNLFLFTVIPDGYEYVRYCLQAAVSSPLDFEIRTGLGSEDDRRQGWCTRINPFIDTEKTVVSADLLDTNTPAQREVTFTLALTNSSSAVQYVGLFDILGQFTFVRQVPGTSNNGEPTYNQIFNQLLWPVQAVSPGASLHAQIVAMVPQGCPSGQYDNEIGFIFRAADTTEYRVVRIPPDRVTVTCQNVLEYSKSANVNVAGLKDRVKYSLQLENRSATRIFNNLTLVDLLPRGFTFESVSADSDIKVAPVETVVGDRVKLTFNVNGIPAKSTRNLTFVARTGNIIGSFENWMWASTTDTYLVRCKSLFGTCRNTTVENQVVNVALAPLAVEPLATLEPKLDTTDCSLPGDERVYTLAMVNTNRHSYQTTLRIRIPFGLQILDYGTSSSAGVLTLPTLTREANGDAVLTWVNITLPEKQFQQVNAQILFNVRLRFGQIYVDTPIIAQADSDDGLILRKDDALDPIIKLCEIDKNYLFKEVSAEEVRKGEDLIYQITLLNSSASASSVSVRDVLPSIFQYQSMLVGPAPTATGNTLTWSNVNVPARTASGPGQISLRFSVRAMRDAASKQVIVNRGELVPANAAFDLTFASASVVFRTPPTIYMPVAFKK